MDMYRVDIQETPDSKVVTHKNITYIEVLSLHEKHNKTSHKFTVYQLTTSGKWALYTEHKNGMLIQFHDIFSSSEEPIYRCEEGIGFSRQSPRDRLQNLPTYGDRKILGE